MNWALGLRECGCDVFLIEHVRSDELEPAESESGLSPQEAFWQATTEEFGFETSNCLFVDGKSDRFEAFQEFANEAALFINYSGQFHFLDLIPDSVRKCYLDVDPAFTQLWVETCGSNMNLKGHDEFFSVGLNLMGQDALVPTLGISWQPLHCAVASSWEDYVAEETSICHGWSTVCHWYGYNDLPWQGRTYGGKRESLLKLIDLPQRSGLKMTIATDLEPTWADYQEFTQAGWQIISAAEVCKNVSSYLGFIRSSRGEVGIAKGGYVTSHCGWVSDRSVTYLALGRPVVAQQTGWSEFIPEQPGFASFTDIDTAVRQLQLTEASYETAAMNALGLSRTTFSAREALAPLLAAAER